MFKTLLPTNKFMQLTVAQVKSLSSKPSKINWEENENQCKIIWEGAVDSPILGKWKEYNVGDESETLKILSEKKM